MKRREFFEIYTTTAYSRTHFIHCLGVFLRFKARGNESVYYQAYYRAFHSYTIK